MRLSTFSLVLCSLTFFSVNMLFTISPCGVCWHTDWYHACLALPLHSSELPRGVTSFECLGGQYGPNLFRIFVNTSQQKLYTPGIQVMGTCWVRRGRSCHHCAIKMYRVETSQKPRFVLYYILSRASFGHELYLSCKYLSWVIIHLLSVAL